MIDEIEAEISRRISTCHEIADLTHNKTGKTKQRARAQALSELLAWVRFQRKISGPERKSA